MPYYEYKCKECGFIFNELCSVDKRDEPTTKPCPNCQKETIEMVIGTTAKAVWKCSLPTNS